MQQNKRRLIQFLILILAILITLTLVIQSERPAPIDENPTEEPTAVDPASEFERPTATPPTPLEVQLAWFYKPPQEDFLHVLPPNFDFFVLTHKDEPQRDRLRNLGVNTPIFQYLLLTEIRDPGNCTERPFGNQVAFRPGDFCRIDVEHPDWFLLDGHGNRIGGSSSGVYFMDPGNPGFRAFWLSRARELQEQYGWDSIFIDNADLSLSRFRNLNRMPQNYRSDKEYQAAVKGFLDYLHQNYFVSSSREMYANITFVKDYEAWREYLNSLDGVLVENFATGWPGRNKSRAEWEEQMNALEEAHDRGITTILVSQGDQHDTNRQEFAFASYLLIANEFTFFRYTLSAYYDEIWLYENYEINLGHPLSSRYREGGIWRRDFLHGYVTVNPRTLETDIVIK